MRQPNQTKLNKMKYRLIAPTGTKITNATFLRWCDQNSVSPWETLTYAQELEIAALALEDAALAVVPEGSGSELPSTCF